jgi:glycosyltransferase involved in cell wall biosynthesis
MNVLHVTQSYHPSIGGTQHTMKKVAECLHEMYDDHVTVYTTNSLTGPNRAMSQKIQAGCEKINGINVHRFEYAEMHKPVIKSFSKFSNFVLKRPLPFYFADVYNGPVSFQMKRSILSSNADVICASSVHYLFADYGKWRKVWRNPKPFVLYGALHLADRAIPQKYLERIKFCDQYIANTQFESDYLVRKGIDEKKINVIGTATDILSYTKNLPSAADIRMKYHLNENDKVIVYLGRQEAFKGLPVLLDAFSQWQKKEPDAKLIIAGATGNYTGTLKDAALSNERIKIFCDISDEQKCELLNMCDTLALPSKEESFGVVFLEAWSFKKPVIGANIGAIASLIDENENGLLFQADNATSLYACIEQLMNDQSKRIEMGLAGFNKVRDSYTWDKIAAAFRNVYIKAIENFRK